MFNTPQDLLYIVLSFCVLWFTVFLCWLLYQAARVLKNANEIIEGAKKTADSWQNIDDGAVWIFEYHR